MADRTMVIGVGNAMRGDDGVGRVVAGEVAKGGVEVLLSDGDPGALIEAWDGADGVVVVDAMSSGRCAGEVVVFDASSTPLPAGMRLGSSHHLGVAEAVELARALERLPPRVVLVGIEGASFDPGSGLSPAVGGAVAAAVAAIEEVLADA